ncbi:glycoside hydrolase family 43 protein [Paenibacillus sinopodophylli]|uniref:glycoside hydrolase family 43 protein n=1 Tax=Paenibacillus sinopodophylli TaxID=1837342 RepID=UPI00110CB347|nr:glycoside hydrolase family 43 protein [Paenibacillus sinopodophylli]
MKYNNPVISGFHPDPSVCRVGDDYYLVTSSFDYFPGVPIFHSKDLVNWTQLGHVLTRENQLPLKRPFPMPLSFGIFAPTIRYNEGRFYVITTNLSLRGKNFYVWAEQPEGPWSDPIYIEGWGGIDPSLHFDQDGKVYLTGNAGGNGEEDGIYQAELEIATGRLLSERRLIWRGTGGSHPEAPHLYHMDGWYYLLIAEGGTEYGHMVTIARSRHPYGPYESNSSNPILSNRSTGKGIQATGHADLVQAADGSWWAVFLGVRPITHSKRHHLGRETNLSAVSWTENGWPIIGEAGQAEIENDAGTLPLGVPELWEPKDDFNSDTLSPVWNFYRNPQPGSWSLTEKPGWLTLNGQSSNLDDGESPAFVGRRQQHFNCEVSSLLEFIPVDDGDEAGLTVYMNENYHYEIARTCKQGQSVVIFRRRIGSLWKVEAEVPYSESTVVFHISATEQHYKFSYATSSGEVIEIGTGETGMLATEVAGGYTGIFIAMYATGNGKDARTSARFDYFEYCPGEEKEPMDFAAMIIASLKNK